MRRLKPYLFAIIILSNLACSNTKSVSSSAPNNDETSETRTTNSESADSNRDGSSFEKAIKVNSIGEEYDYVRKVCPSCKMQKQALVHNKKNPYDILYFKHPDGMEVQYYFDISSFFGKW
ncbi:MAG: hypothetical protein NWQ55_03840 [Salibacteraceae bacterium]|nr:hypothetical protein [Salibacteraceae bacterium]